MMKDDPDIRNNREENHYRMELKSGTQQNGFPGFRLNKEVWI
jgi:hypothetical protein